MIYYYIFLFFSFTVATVLILCYQDVRLNNPSVLHVNMTFVILQYKCLLSQYLRNFFSIYFCEQFKFFHLKSLQGAMVRSIDLRLRILGLGVFNLSFFSSLSF